MAEDWKPPAYATAVAEKESEGEWKPPSYAKEAEEEPGLLDKASKFLVDHPKIREIAERLLTGTSKENEEMFNKSGIKSPIKSGEEKSLLPDWKSQPETFTGGFAKSIYNDFIKPLGTPSGILGSSSVNKIPLKVGELVPEEGTAITNPNRLLPEAPYTVSPKGTVNPAEFPIRRSVEKPYRSSDSFSTASDTNLKSPVRAGFQVPEKPTSSDLEVRKSTPEGMDTFHKASFTAVGDEDIFNADRPRQGVNDIEQTIYENNKKRLGGLQKDESPLDLSQNEPQAAKTSGGKLAIGADVKSLGKVLGTSLYKGDIAPIATKELLQNSIDAVRHLGDKGVIDVAINHADNTISVSDNGKGLTKQELESVFTDLGSSGKRDDESASGGFGLAKAAPLLGGKKVEVTTVAKDPKTGKMMESHFEGTPDELLEGVDIRQRIAPDDAQTGTHVKVYVPPNSSMYDAKDFVVKMSNSSHGLAAKVRLSSHHLAEKDFPISGTDFDELPKAKGKTLTILDNPSAKTEIILPENEERSNRSYMRVNYSNNGMYQGGKTMYFDGEVPNIPKSITVDIHSKVPEGHSDYPFTTNREELRGTVEKQVEQYIQDNLVKPAYGKRMEELQRLYRSMPEIQIGKGEFPNNFGRKIVVYDPKGKYSPEEMKAITDSPIFHKLAGTIAETIDKAMNVMDVKEWNNRLEKIGIIFDERLHGIHIPNPGSKHSAILINPFQVMSAHDPDVAGASILHTILHEIAHIDLNAPSGHNESFTIRLGDIYSKFGAARSVDGQAKIIRSISDDTGKYTPEIQDLLQSYQDSRGREGTTEDLLSGTGVKQGSRGKGKDSVSSNGGSDGERTTSAVNKLLTALEHARELNTEQQSIYKAEKARRFAAFEGVKQGGQAGAAKSLGKLKGEYDKVEGTTLELDQKEVDTLFNAVKRANITTGEKARGYVALFKLLEGGNVPQRNELKLLDDVFGNGFSDKILELQGGLGAVSIKLAKAANTMKSILTLVHFSAPLRQGIGLIHKAEWRDSFVEMFKYFANKEYYEAAMQAIEQRPNYLLSREAGLFMAKPNNMLEGEEQFMNNYIPSLPSGIKSLGVKNTYEASQRAYLGFLNKLRADTFDDLIADAKKFGHEAFTVAEHVEDGQITRRIVPSKTTENIAKFINISTGRGSLGVLDKMAPELNTVIWSPRLIASRLTVLNPKYYADMDPFTRKESIKSLLAIAAASTAMLGLAKLAGGKVSTDPTSADFHKARFKNSVLDPNGGFQQPIVAASRMIAEVNRMQKGKKPTYSEQNIPEIATNFLRSKESPMAGLIDDIASSKEFTGGGGYVNRFGAKTSVQAEVINRFRPIFEQDMSRLLQDDPNFAEGLGLGAANLFGAGLQDYPEKHPKGTMSIGKMRLR